MESSSSLLLSIRGAVILRIDVVDEQSDCQYASERKEEVTVVNQGEGEGIR